MQVERIRSSVARFSDHPAVAAGAWGATIGEEYDHPDFDDDEDDDGEDEYDRYRRPMARAVMAGKIDLDPDDADAALAEGDGDISGKGKYADIGGWVDSVYELDESDIEWEDADTAVFDRDVEPTDVFHR
jgi:hypothetical protein